MKKQFAVVLLCALALCSTAHAGLLRTAEIAGVSYVIKKTIIPAALSGAGREAAIAAVKKFAANPKAQHAVYGSLSYLLVVMPNTQAGKSAADILLKGGVFENPEIAQSYREEHANYQANVKALTAEATALDKSGRSRCVNTQDIYATSLPQYLDAMSSFNMPVREWDYGSYKQLRGAGKPFDKLDHDHIPAKATIYRYLEKRDGIAVRNTARQNFVMSNTTAIEVRKTLHTAGRTYGGYKESEIEGDIKDLRVATIKDFAYYFMTSPMSGRELKSFSSVYLRNKALCIYQ